MALAIADVTTFILQHLHYITTFLIFDENNYSMLDCK